MNNLLKINRFNKFNVINEINARKLKINFIEFLIMEKDK